MKNTNEKADTILVLFAATENQKGVSVITHYTDVFVLLCFIIRLRHLDNFFNIDKIYFAKMVHRIDSAQLQQIKDNASETFLRLLYINI